MSENNHISIPKKVETEDQSDFHFLRRTGIKYIEELGGKLWTDYNSHDPGITTLEVLSYAITDLGMRMNLGINDILSSNDQEKGIDKQFIKTTEILPSRALNELDYRKLFIDIGEKQGRARVVKNCWLRPRTEPVYTDCETGKLALDPSELDTEKIQSFNLKGLYDLYVDYGKDIDSNSSLDECDKSNVRVQILDKYHANRNLCEDLVDIKEIGTQDIAVCAKIDLANKANEEMVHARILNTISNYLSPAVNFYSLKQMLEKGLTTDQIFDGPLLENGFIDTEELKNSQLRKEVRLSDIIGEIMKIDGVKEIKEISIAGCNSSSLQLTDEWVICIEEGKKPVLCELSSFSYTKGVLPLNINDKKVKDYLETFEEEQETFRDDARLNKVPDLPKGTTYDIGNYASILNEFPDTYGVGVSGIIGNQDLERQALAKQMQGYLLFFDKILAGYFKHLEKVKEILSVNGNLKRTYFTQALKNIRGFDELVNNYETNDDDKLTDSLYKEMDNSVERRNEILDHLISRFAEVFSDYTFLMKSLYGKSSDEIILKNKEVFLSEYKDLSANRGLGYNYSLINEDEIWDTDNISGAQKRIARLLGIKNYNQRNLSNSPIQIIENVDGNNDVTYKWKIRDAANNVVLCSVKSYQVDYAATKDLNEAVYQTIQIDQEELEERLQANFFGGEQIGNIVVHKSGMNNFYLEILDDSTVQTVIASHKKTNPYTTQQALKDGILNLVDYLKYQFTEEGFFLLEHILLKPAFKDYNLLGGIGCMAVENTFIVMYDDEITHGDGDYSGAMMSTCEGDCEAEIFDPYSYRVSIVLPGYTYRFSDPDFRRYAETVIRQELPAHVLAKICWVGDRYTGDEEAQNDLQYFEEKFKKFLFDKARNNVDTLGQSIKDLLDALSNLNNIYRPGRLLDCAADDNDIIDGKIILGQSHTKQKIQ